MTDEQEKTYCGLRDEGMSFEDAIHAALQPTAPEV